MRQLIFKRANATWLTFLPWNASRPPRPASFAMLMLAMHLTLVVTMMVRIPPNADEPAHLASGLYHWQTGRFDAFQVNPPLIRLWCTAPLAAMQVTPRWQVPLDNDGGRLEWQLDDQLCAAWDYSQLRSYLLVARLTLLPLVALGGVYCWRWGTLAYGATAGWVAWLLWIGCPNLLSWSATICPDVTATSLGLAATFHFRQWLVTPRFTQASLTGLFTGLAILAKSTWIVLPPLLLIVCLTRWHGQARPKCALRMIAWAALLTVTSIHLGYGFVGTGQRLGAVRFRSQWLSASGGESTGNRFARGVLGRLPLPLPADLLRGIDRQRHEFERGKWSYLAGEWNPRGWPLYYLHCALWKIPEGFLCLWVMSWLQRNPRRCASGALAAVDIDGGAAHEPGRPTEARNSCGSRAARDSTVLAALYNVRPAPPDGMILGVAFFSFGTVVSSQTGFGHHFRYAFPCLPYAYLLASSCFAPHRARWCKRVAFAALVVGLLSGLSAWPRSHSYFNSLARCIFAHPPLLESNLEWGEDLDLAARWLCRHPHAQPVYYAVVTDDLAAAMRLVWQPAPRPLATGWYVVSLQRVLDPRDRFGFLRDQVPVSRLGRSLRVYRVLAED